MLRAMCEYPITFTTSIVVEKKRAIHMHEFRKNNKFSSDYNQISSILKSANHSSSVSSFLHHFSSSSSSSSQTVRNSLLSVAHRLQLSLSLSLAFSLSCIIYIYIHISIINRSSSPHLRLN